jgi:hypothetical protein
VTTVGLLTAASARADETTQPAAAESTAAAAPLDTGAIKALESRVSELEAQNLLNHFHFGGYFVFRFDAIDYRPDGDASKANHSYPLSMRLALNVDVDVSDELKFYSTFGMNKLANMAFTTDAVPVAADFQGSYFRASSSVYIDRAYLEYRPRSLPVAFSAGRLPTVDGPPSHLWDGEPRLGTYPMIWFASIVDGLSLTLNLGKLLPEGHSLYVRGVYAPTGQYDIASPYKQLQSGGTLYPSHIPAGSLMVEYAVKDTAFAENANLILGYLDTGDWKVDPNVVVPPGTPPLGGDYAMHFRNLVSYLELDNIAHSDLTLAALFVESITSTTGTTVLVPANIPTATGAPTVWGGSFLLNLRYQLPVAALNRPYLGVEYLYSTRNAWPNNLASEDLTGFYSTRGRAFHVYYTQPITAGLKLRVGFRRQNIFGANEMPTGFGGAGTDDRFNTYYANLRLDF